jgi:rhodanese-related sulfurtransferase
MMIQHALKLLFATLFIGALTACGSTQDESTSMMTEDSEPEAEHHQRSEEGASTDEVEDIVASGEETYAEDKTEVIDVDGQTAQILAAEGATIIDVRSPEEYEEAHVPGAMNIPVSEMSREAVQEEDINGRIILYCNSGNRSMQAYEELSSDGYVHQIYNLGPMSEWPGETVSGSQADPEE